MRMLGMFLSQRRSQARCGGESAVVALIVDESAGNVLNLDRERKDENKLPERTTVSLPSKTIPAKEGRTAMHRMKTPAAYRRTGSHIILTCFPNPTRKPVPTKEITAQ